MRETIFIPTRKFVINHFEQKILTVDELVDFLQEDSQATRLEIQVVLKNTLTGMVFHDNGEIISVDYSKLSVREDFFGPSNRNLHVTRSFPNPSDGTLSIGFFIPVKININESMEDAVIACLSTIFDLQREWIFPTDYEEAEIALIQENDDYVLRANSFKGSNFYEYIRSYNNPNYPAIEKMHNEIIKKSSLTVFFENANKIPCVFCISKIDNRQNLYVISSVQTSYLNN